MMNRKAAAFLLGVYAASAAGVSVAQDQKRLSDGEHFALQRLEEIPGQGTTGIFAFRLDPKGVELPGAWVTFLSITCRQVLDRGAFMTALDTRLGARADLPALTGADWTKLEDEIFKATSKLHDLCNATSSAPSVPKIVAQAP